MPRRSGRRWRRWRRRQRWSPGGAAVNTANINCPGCAAMAGNRCGESHRWGNCIAGVIFVISAGVAGNGDAAGGQGVGGSRPRPAQGEARQSGGVAEDGQDGPAGGGGGRHFAVPKWAGGGVKVSQGKSGRHRAVTPTGRQRGWLGAARLTPPNPGQPRRRGPSISHRRNGVNRCGGGSPSISGLGAAASGLCDWGVGGRFGQSFEGGAG